MADEITFDSTTKTALSRARKVGPFLGPLALMLSHNPALAIDMIEAIGAEKCGGPAKAYQVEFLAPDSASLEATAKAIVRGATDLRPEAVTLSIHGTCARTPAAASRPRRGRATSWQPRAGSLGSMTSASESLDREV